MPNNTVTRTMTEIPLSSIANHFVVDAHGNVTLKTKEIADAIKAKLAAGPGAGAAAGATLAAIRVAVDSG